MRARGGREWSAAPRPRLARGIFTGDATRRVIPRCINYDVFMNKKIYPGQDGVCPAFLVGCAFADKRAGPRQEEKRNMCLGEGRAGYSACLRPLGKRLGRVYKIHSANLAVLFALAFVVPRAVISSIATLVAPRPAPKIPRDL